jgi:hypothetical protein
VAIAFYSKEEMEQFMIAVNERRQDGQRPKAERERSVLMWDTRAACPSLESPRELEEWEGSHAEGDHEPFHTLPSKDMVARLEELKSKSGNRRKGRTQELEIKRAPTPTLAPAPARTIASSNPTVSTIKARDKKEEVGRFLRERCTLLSGDREAMEKVIAAVQSYGLETTADIGKRIMDDTLLVHAPASPVSSFLINAPLAWE